MHLCLWEQSVKWDILPGSAILITSEWIKESNWNVIWETKNETEKHSEERVDKEPLNGKKGGPDSETGWRVKKGGKEHLQ
jgi:hypothetical protein